MAAAYILSFRTHSFPGRWKSSASKCLPSVRPARGPRHSRDPGAHKEDRPRRHSAGPLQPATPRESDRDLQGSQDRESSEISIVRIASNCPSKSLRTCSEHGTAIQLIKTRFGNLARSMAVWTAARHNGSLYHQW